MVLLSGCDAEEIFSASRSEKGNIMNLIFCGLGIRLGKSFNPL